MRSFIKSATTQQAIEILDTAFTDGCFIVDNMRVCSNDITNLPGITLATVSGVREAQIHIEISERTLRQYGLTLGQVAEAIRQGSLDLPAGSVKTSGSEILIRTKGRRYHAADYEDIAVITRADGSKVTLGQIAELHEGFEDVDRFSRFKGKPAAVVQVYRVADQKALEVAGFVNSTTGDM